MNKSFWNKRKVLITGFSGFKGAWLSFWLAQLGARLSGIALPPENSDNLYDVLNIDKVGNFMFCDINDNIQVKNYIERENPEIIIHMAAQALVRSSYADPLGTFLTNVSGTASLLEAARSSSSVQVILVITSDKVYENKEWVWGYREDDDLGGYDPYSASKACAEIITESMKRSFFGNNKHKARIATVRAGNVIGGGDWSADRLVPDIIRGCYTSEQSIVIRNPNSVRPWQHVIDPLNAYLLLCEKLFLGDTKYACSWNIGPDSTDNRRVIDLVNSIINITGRGKVIFSEDINIPHEAKLLTLDCSKAHEILGWRPLLGYDKTVRYTVEWYNEWYSRNNLIEFTKYQLSSLGLI